MKRKLTDMDRIDMQEAWLNISGMIVFIGFCYWVHGTGARVVCKLLEQHPAFFVLALVFILGPMFLINIYTEIHNQKIDKELLFEQEKKEAKAQAEADKEKAELQIWVSE